MISYGKVRSTIAPKEIEVLNGEVYVASNIQPFEEEFDEYVKKGYEYDYIKYSSAEYIQLLMNKNNELQQQIIDTQLAVCEIYESLGGI